MYREIMGCKDHRDSDNNDNGDDDDDDDYNYDNKDILLTTMIIMMI